MVYYGASREALETRFCRKVANGGYTPDSVRRKMDLLLNPDTLACYDPQNDHQMPPSLDPDSALSLLTPEQRSVACKIIGAVLHEVVLDETDQLMFLQGSAGTGKALIFQALINALHSLGKKYVICGTTGIAAVQYPGRITLHSLFHLGIDGQSTGAFCSNIRRGTPPARHILTADLSVSDEVLMSTHWVED
jgi:hypothetical protein